MPFYSSYIASLLKVKGNIQQTFFDKSLPKVGSKLKSYFQPTENSAALINNDLVDVNDKGFRNTSITYKDQDPQHFFSSTAPQNQGENSDIIATPLASFNENQSGEFKTYKPINADPPIKASHLANKGYVDSKALDQLGKPTSSLDLNNQKIINLSTPTLGTDAATKSYVDNRPITTSQITDFNTAVPAFRLDQFGTPTSYVNFNNQFLSNVRTPYGPNDGANKAYVDSSFSQNIQSGSWTPNLVLSLSDGRIVENLACKGTYVKIGKMVFITAAVDIGSYSAPCIINLNSLPFNPITPAYKFIPVTMMGVNLNGLKSGYTFSGIFLQDGTSIVAGFYTSSSYVVVPINTNYFIPSSNADPAFNINTSYVTND